MSTEHLVLAGGGHSHALMLLRWAMDPRLRPARLITVVNRNSTTFYSGMVPGLAAGIYTHDEISIDLRRLASQAGVALVVAEIIGVDVKKNCLLLSKRPPITFNRLSIDVGAETFLGERSLHKKKTDLIIPIKPLEPAIHWIEQQDQHYIKEGDNGTEQQADIEQ